MTLAREGGGRRRVQPAAEGGRPRRSAGRCRRQVGRCFAPLLGVIVLSAACTSSPASSTSSTATTTPGSSTATTTTTTLPVPVSLPGTSDPGAAFLGPVERVPVVAVPAGEATVPVPVAGSPGYLSLQQIAFRQFGAGANLLLIMGQDGSMSWWEPSLLAVLARHYRVTEFDLPGVGYSAPATSPVTLNWFADETAGLIEALDLSDADVLGWGLGGDVALALAERHPASERSVILVDTSAGGPRATRPSAQATSAFDSPAATPDSLAPVLFGLKTPLTGLPASAVAVAEAAQSAWLGSLAVSVPDDVTRAALSEEEALQRTVWSSAALAAGLGSVAVPTLVVYGADDTVYPAADGLLLRRAIASADRVVLPKAGYAGLFEYPALFVSALEQFTG